MHTYPKIYSLSTAGVRQHNNADYLLHAVRTDFTGENGLGKSIIADLMQLVFVPKRDLWRPGTEGIDKSERRIEGIPLNKEYVQHAYAFMNIEKGKGQFITIGAYIPKNHRLPVRPFIVQQKEDFEGKVLHPSPRPLMSADFIGENKLVLDLKDIKHKLQSMGLFLKDFYQSDEINLYYELLYKNFIIPIDLTKENNLKAFAKILQSFSRAKTLDITNSRSLQNFLFEDNDEIKNLFDEQKEQLENYIKQYNINRREIRQLEEKQSKLTKLQVLFEKSSDARKEYIKADVTNASQKYHEAIKLYEQNKNRRKQATASLEKNTVDIKGVTENLVKFHAELKTICEEEKSMLEAMLPSFSNEAIEQKRKEANGLFILISELEKILPVYKKYNTYKAAQEKFLAQEKIKEQKKMLEKLTSIKSFAQFEKSAWSKDYRKAYDFYQTRLAQLPAEIDQYRNLISLYESDSPDSFFHWAVKQKKALTLGQETLLMRLKDVFTKKPGSVENGLKFTPDPKVLLNSFEEDKNKKGIWLRLGELHEFVDFVGKQKFGNADTLKSAIEKDKEEIKKSLKAADEELKTIQKLNAELSEIGYSREFAEVYSERKTIEAFEFDEELNEAALVALKQHADTLGQYDTLKENYTRADSDYKHFIQQQTQITTALEQAKRDLEEYQSEYNRLQREVDFTVKSGESKYKGLKIEELNAHKELVGSLVHQEINKRATASINIAQQKEIINSCNEREPQLKRELDRSKTYFEEKRAFFEEETESKFDQLLHLGEYPDRLVQQFESESYEARRKYENAFSVIAQSFEETRDNKSAELETDKFNFFTLVKILCGKIGLEKISEELEQLNKEIKRFGDLQLNLIIQVFSKVKMQYESASKLTKELNFFFLENKISNGYYFRIDFNDRKDITIDWISKMLDRAKIQRFGADLFSQVDEDDHSPEKLIVNLAKTFSQVKNCEIADLLNPKFYFDLRVGLFDDTGNRYTGSGGQAYTAIALLCIGRLSVIQKDKNRPGVKFIIIEELSNIDDVNFNLFPQIAEQFGYQLLTMTPKPFGSYTEESWYLHMLVRGKDKDINYQPMSFFKTKNTKQELKKFFGYVNELEAK